jgi:ADP-ribosyl-[dinitrogen reductase] hydrolase
MIKDNIYGVLFGAAVGDALGAPLEFLTPRSEGSFVTDMIGGGILKHEVGATTDDTEMAIGIMRMYERCGKYDQKDVITNWLNWLHGNPKDIGNFTYKVLRHWEGKEKFPLRGDENPAVQIWKMTGSKNAGNGSVMRCMPTACFYYNDEKQMVEDTIFLSEDTHSDPKCILSCLVVNKLIRYGILGVSKQNAYKMIVEEFSKIDKNFGDMLIDANEMPWDEWQNSGYTINTVKCALAAFLQYDNFEEALIRVVNRGDDADTVGAVAGSIIGAFDGIKSIPKKWIDKMYKPKMLEIKTFCELCIERNS